MSVVTGIGHGAGAEADGMIPVPINTQVWLAAGVTDIINVDPAAEPAQSVMPQTESA